MRGVTQAGALQRCIHNEENGEEVAIIEMRGVDRSRWPYEVATAIAGRAGYPAMLPVRAVVRLRQSRSIESL